MVSDRRGWRSLSQAQKQAFMLGMRDAIGPFIAVATWGFVTGIAMVKSGLTENMAVLMTLTVYAGSMQLTALPLIESQAPLWLIFGAGAMVNLRFIIFGAALYPYLGARPWPQRLALGYLTSDISFVLFMARYGGSQHAGTASQLWYFLGIILPGWVVWVVFSILGVYLGGLVPPDWSLEFAAILALLAIVIPLVKTRPMVMCLLTAGVVAWFGQLLPLRMGLVAAVVAGIIAGMLSERLLRQRAEAS